MKLKFRHKDKILQILLLLLCSEVRCLENGGNSDQVVHFGRLLFSSTRPRPENEGVDSAEFVKDTSEFQSDQPESTGNGYFNNNVLWVFIHVTIFLLLD